MRKITIFLFT